MRLLDCTIRDGGYYTQWDFPEELISLYFDTVNALPIDLIELGYRYNQQEEYFGEFFYCPTHVCKLARERLPEKEICIILDEKNTQTKDLEHLIDPIADYIDMVRIAVAPDKIAHAIELSKVIRQKELKVSLNIMYLSEWVNDPQFLVYADEINEYIDAMYLVDSFGAVYPHEIGPIVTHVRSKVNIDLGFHGHNNLELALANSIAALDNGVTYIDSTFTGMGRGAGNLKTELFLTYLQSRKEIPFDFNEVTRLVEEFENLRAYYSWGTSLPYMISGAYSIPQKDIMNWISTKRYSLSNIVNATINKKNQKEDNLKLDELDDKLAFDTAIIIGGGTSVLRHKKGLLELVSKKENTCLIHSSTRFASDYANCKESQFYCLAGNEIERLTKQFKKLDDVQFPCILPPYPRKMGTILPRELKNKSFQISSEWPKDGTPDLDSPLALAIMLALRLKCSNVFLIGFDGYQNVGNIKIDKMKITQENQYIIDYFKQYLGKPLTTLTPSYYQNLTEASIYAKLADQ